MPTTWPPKRIRGSTTGRPIMRLLDLLGRRWVLRILWELRDGPLSSRALRAACDDISPSVLQARLNDLRAAGLVALQAGSGYAMTERARSLTPLLLQLQQWAEAWSKDMNPART
jgi:DNA-binding HxlR family transcriptional regulator